MPAMSELLTPEAADEPTGTAVLQPAPTRGEDVAIVDEPEVAQRLIAGAVADKAGRSAAVDALRAIAALMVVGMHTVLLAPEPDRPNPVLHLLRSHLWTGVDLFFAISGFLIAGPFLRALLMGRALPDTRGYVTRRVARIVPGYWVALSVVVVLLLTGAISSSVVGTSGDVGAGAVVSHYLFVHNWVPGESRDLFVVAWTLSIEILFYLVVPVGAAVIRRFHPGPIPRRRLVAIVLGIGAVSLVWNVVWGLGFDHVTVLREHVDDWRTVITDNLPAQLALFCPGMLLAVLFAGDGSVDHDDSRRWWHSAPSSGLLVAGMVIGLLGIAAGERHLRSLDAVRDSLLLPIACGFPLLVFLRGGPLVRALSRVLAPVGVISYGIYLWHWTVGGVLGTWALDHGTVLAGGQWFAWIVAFLILCAVSFPLALASWVFVERPALQSTAIWNRRRVAASASARG
jgi:peptidoglycan/LPS O-acetylase OafA/YrhL